MSRDSQPTLARSESPIGSILGGFVLGGALLVLLACGGGGGGGDAADLPFGLTQRAPLAQLAFPPQGLAPTDVGLVRAFGNLFFDGRPVFLTTAPDPRQSPGDTAWIYVVEQDGQVHVFPNDDAVVGTSIFMDLSAGAGGPVSRATDEEGLLGLAFDPDFATNGYVYVHYSAASPRRSIIARYHVTFPADPADPPFVDATLPLVIMSVAQPFSNHNAGMLAFGPDGMLYIAMGDGGSGNDPQGHGQRLDTLLGAMLRVDVRGADAATPYVVPGDNPFVGIVGEDEIWAYGLRNPWRFSFDRGNGEMWLGDVGQIRREEINVITRGANYGWVAYEGALEHLNGGNIPANQVVAPVVDYDRGQGTTVVGGYRYRGQDVPTIRDAYMYGDHGSGRIWALVPDGLGGFLSNTYVADLGGLSSFGEDERGELYAVSLWGTIHRFTEPAGPPPPAFPATLSATGLFTDLVGLTPASGFVPYDLNSPLWSDDAVKQRWIGIPDGQTITYSAAGNWQFPVGTVIIKHFELELTVGDAGSRRRLETRVLIHEPAGWSGYTYRWNAAQTDADLLPGGLDETFTINDPLAPDGTREQTWSYPSRAQCLQCHTQASGRVLGVRTGQLHRLFDYDGVVDNQLRSWDNIGLFTFPIGVPPQGLAWANPADAAETLQRRARAYLAANCAQCHQPGAPAPGGMDMRHDTPNGGMNLFGVAPTEGNLGLPAPLRIDGGSSANSVLWLRMHRLDALRMPALGSALVDDAGAAVIRDWIDSDP